MGNNNRQFSFYLIGLIGLCTIVRSTNSNAVKGKQNIVFEANSMLRDSSSSGITVSSTSASGSHSNSADGQPSTNEVLHLSDKEQYRGIIETNNNLEYNAYRPVAIKSPSSSSSSSSTSSGNKSNDDTESISSADADNDSTTMLSLNDQVRLLTKQLNALMTRRREDYDILEKNLRKSLRITSNAANVDVDIRNELDQLRYEMKLLRDSSSIGGASGGSGRGGGVVFKEKLTIDWITQSIAEIRKELTELQQVASNASKDINRRRQNFEDITTIRSDFQQFKLELEALRQRQEKTEVFVRELREESLQQEEDFIRMLHNHKRTNVDDKSAGNTITMNTKPEIDHKRRHHRFERQQLHDLEMSQRDVKRQLNELQYHRIGERVRSLEIEQHRIAGANFNLSRQIASLDKLHTSMLELLEDVEGIQNKMDKTIPDVRREISKLEFTNAQLSSEQNLMREEGKNVARSVQAMAVSVSALQEDRDTVKDMQSAVGKLKQEVDRLQNTMSNVEKSIVHRRRIEMLEAEAGQLPQNITSSSDQETLKETQNLVDKLETVELQYEAIINKLPNDCSELSQSTESKLTTSNGIYLIAPAGQHRPTMAHCSNDGWTTIQRRYDGSVDFNRSWESYANGFGNPSGEYWIGNEMLHHLTSAPNSSSSSSSFSGGNSNQYCTELKIVMQDIYDNTWNAQYTDFRISSRNDGYRLHISGYHGNASDALDYQNDMQFSAVDVDRDISNTHCAANYEGGWWFSHCQHANLNGRYNLGLTWFDASRNEWIAVKSSQMLIKRHPQCNNNAEIKSIITSDNNVEVSKVNSSTIIESNSSGSSVRHH